MRNALLAIALLIAALAPPPAHGKPKPPKAKATAKASATPAAAKATATAAAPAAVVTAMPAATATPAAAEATPLESTAVAVIEERLGRLEAEYDELRHRLGSPRKPEVGHLSLAGEAKVRFAGYLDAGFFDAAGDGVAYVRDVAKEEHPEFGDHPWVFLGDPWSNPVNSQGDSADLGLDRTNINRFDPIHSAGRPSFLVNTMNLGLVGSVGPKLLFETSLNFEPRQGALGSSGDEIDIDLAYVEWVPRSDLDLHVFAGKFESTFGIEYRTRKAPDRTGVTPSIIARYTTGTPTGLKIRGSVLRGTLIYNAALTNGGTFTEKFAHFTNEIDANSGKTGSLRLSVKAPTAVFFEVGASGLAGAQDLQADDEVLGWQIGADAKLVAGDLTLRAEYLRGQDEGGGLSDAPWLKVEGWYAEASWQAFAWVGGYARADFRHARLSTPPNLYVTDTGRATVGLRFDLSMNAIAKVEYLRVAELSGPEIDDDILTSSFLFRF